jgi:hypothetical protein
MTEHVKQAASEILRSPGKRDEWSLRMPAPTAPSGVSISILQFLQDEKGHPSSVKTT